MILIIHPDQRRPQKRRRVFERRNESSGMEPELELCCLALVHRSFAEVFAITCYLCNNLLSRMLQPIGVKIHLLGITRAPATAGDRIRLGGQSPADSL